ncbi:hypothetical protein BJ878DRAFT_540470 [Calycina marina]|uniref:RRM domain-containing protein n=1 Tax=Calycina marina TaxID=1763456 RepID=A0A9P7Z787_9HELO|nr:hypothetical protein BJ878DRAFT_540470 [Calycina marina]
MASMDYENENGTREYEEAPRYEQQRDRSASPRPDRRNASPRGGPRRSASPGGNGVEIRGPATKRENGGSGGQGDDGAINPGSNLFVTGIHPRLSEAEVTRLFEKYGDVEKCQIMLDPHTKESRGFGFVKMVTAEQADAAKEGLQGEVIEGRTLSIEKARRSRPQDDPRQGRSYGGRDDRYGDRRGGGGYGGGRDYGRRDYDDRDRGYGRDRYDDRRPVDRYGGGGRDDRYGGDRRGGGGYGRDDRSYDRGDRRDGPPPAQYGDPAPRREVQDQPYGERPAR